MPQSGAEDIGTAPQDTGLGMQHRALRGAFSIGHAAWAALQGVQGTAVWRVA